MCQIPQAESSVVEFKREWAEKNDGENIKKTIVAFANTAGGDLYIGVDDDGTVAGVDSPTQLEERVTCAVRDNIQPSLAGFVSIERIGVQGKTVLRVHVDSGNMKPYCLDPRNTKTIFVRMNNATFPATVDEVAAMVRQNNPVPFEKRVSFEQDLTFNECMEFCQERGISFDPKANLSFGFWDKTRNAYTNLAFLCSDQSDAAQVEIQFSDDEKLQVVQQARVTGSVFRLYKEAVKFIESTNYAWLEKKREGNAERVDHYIIDPRVVLEAVVNMLAHRDYSRKAANLIHVTPSKVELSSIGGLVEGLSVADIVERMNTECRNPGLARLFGVLHLMESRGTGFRLIRAFYKDRSVSDLLSVTDTSFSITLPRLKSRFYTDNAEYRRVFAVLSDRGSATRQEIQQEMGWTQTRIITLLAEMQRDGLLEKVGGGRSTRYKIKSA